MTSEGGALMMANKMIPYDNSRSYSHGLSFSNFFLSSPIFLGMHSTYLTYDTRIWAGLCFLDVGSQPWFWDWHSGQHTCSWITVVLYLLYTHQI
jgi:hypothetical protein